MNEETQVLGNLIKEFSDRDGEEFDATDITISIDKKDGKLLMVETCNHMPPLAAIKLGKALTDHYGWGVHMKHVVNNKNLAEAIKGVETSKKRLEEAGLAIQEAQPPSSDKS